MNQSDVLNIQNYFASVTHTQASFPEYLSNELLSRFGIKSALDVIKFLQSPEGKITETCIKQAIERAIEKQEMAEILSRLELQKKQYLAYFILSLEHDEEKAREHLRNVEEENQHTQASRKHIETNKATSSSPRPTHELSTEETLFHYEKAKEVLLQELSFTTQEVDTLEHELFLLTQSISLLFTKKRLQESIHQLFQTLGDHDVMDEKYIQSKINEASRAYREEMVSLRSMKTNQITPSFVEHWNLLDTYQLQLHAWDDFRNALQPGQTIVQKNGVLYLCERGQTFESLSFEAREKAAHAYLMLKPKLEKTRLKIDEEDQLQQAALEEKKTLLINQIDFERAKINFFQIRLQTLNSSIQTITQLIHKSKETKESEQSNSSTAPQLKPSFSAPRTPKPSPSVQQTKPRPPEPSITVSQLMLKLEMCELRSKKLAPTYLPPEAISKLAAIERAKLIEELKARPKELIPGTQLSPSLLSMLISLNKTTLNIDKRVNATPEQRVEDEKNDPTATPRSRPTPFKKQLDPF